MGRLIAFASLPLRLVPPSPGRSTSELVFRTTPSVNKIEIKRFLEAVWGLKVARVATANYEGKKKRSPGGYGYMRRPDWKKVWVTLDTPVRVPEGAYLGAQEKGEASSTTGAESQ